MLKTYVPHYKHDIFVSYARVDDQPFAGAEKGWVTTLINGLKNYLGKKLGGSDAYSLWMDDELRGNTPVTATISEKLENTALLVLILSPGYLASQWCRLEFNIFLATVGKNSGRVFVVEHDQVETRPNELSDLRGYKFWKHDDAGKPRILAIPKPNPDKEPEYYPLLDDLARELTEKLQTLKAQTPPIPNSSVPLNEEMFFFPKPEPKAQTTVFLAEVTSDLMAHRSEVKRYLESQNVQVLPNKRYDFATPEEFEQLIKFDLKQATCFIQLLSPTLNSLQVTQYHHAQNLELPILQWRAYDLDINTITDATHHTLLTKSTVIATSLLEFQQHIAHFLQKPIAQSPLPTKQNTASDELVFVNATPSDMNLAHQIKQVLIQKGLGCSLPLENVSQASPEQIREDLENNLLFCDAVIVLDHQNTDTVWVRRQLFQCQRARGKREQAFKAIVVCKHHQKSSANLQLSDMHTFECLPPFHNTCVAEFLQVL